MQVFISHQAIKQYSKIPKSSQQKVKNGLQLLSRSPMAGKSLKGKLEGCYSLRCWPYRIIYQYDNSKTALNVLSIIHRQSAYT